MNIKYHIFFLVVLFLLSIPKAESQNNISEVDTAKLRSELRALSITADTLNANEEYDKYEDCLFQELEICYTLADTVLSAKIMYDLAVSFANTLRSAEALKYLNKSMSICQKTSDSALLGEIYYKLGAIYAETRIYDMALDYTNRYLKIAKSLGNDKGVLSAEV
ncbi:MAG: tetratricopeptide repeat protein, partial [Bacteroidales bacterium]|nr:tetratricopeptide repeat protein [Bacteroidales bacterium]